MVLTPIDFHYLIKELKIIESGVLKRIYKSEDYVFEFKSDKERFFLVVGKGFCYLNNREPEETESRGFPGFLSSKLKNKRLLKIEQNDFNKILILGFSDFNLILEFIGKGNIILTDKDNKIISCLFQREFKDRKIIVGEKYNFPPKSDKLHIGEIYKSEISEENNLEKLLNQKINPRIYFKNGEKFFISPIELETLTELESKKIKNFSEAVKEFFSEKRKTKENIIKESQKSDLEKYRFEEKKFKRWGTLILKYRNEIKKSIEKFKRDKRIVGPLKNISKKGTIILEIEGEKIEMDINKGLKIQTDIFYEKSRKVRGKSEKIEKLLSEKTILKEKELKKEKAKKEWYGQFRHFHTSDGFLVIAGKDAETNEKLIKKYCKKNDIVLHAHIPGSPFGVVRSEGKKISAQAIKEASQFVACYSRFWISKLGIADIYWVNPEQVTKKAKVGEYLARGSFMIYGKKNFLRVELRLVIGVNKNFEVIKYPENSGKKLDKYSVVLMPGETEGKKLGEKIKSELIKKAKKEDKEKILEINLDEFLKIVPFGKGEIV